jgi:hypothetical protein
MIKLSAAYSKKVGLPGYSSHSFSVSIETELQNLDNVREESARLYDSLQQAVDQQIQKTGFVPPDGYGMEENNNGAWNCSQKQRELIEKIGRENNLDQNVLDGLAGEMFGASVQGLNKLQASGLIDELLDRYGKRTQQAGRYGRRYVGRSHAAAKGGATT